MHLKLTLLSNFKIFIMKNILFITLITAFVILSAGCNKKSQPLELNKLFGNNMVLQANMQIPVWGTATPDANVTVAFRGQFVTTKTGSDGKFKLALDAEQYGGPDSMVITCKTNKIVLQNVMVGEVWVCSGQSNMEMPVDGNWAKLNNAKIEVEQANYPNIRLFTVKRNIAFQPVDTIATDGWQQCSPQSIKEFSATAYFFGRKLHTELNVPVGLIHSSWGGTDAEAWTSANTLKNIDLYAERTNIVSSLNVSRDSLLAKYKHDWDKREAEIAQAETGIKGTDTIFKNPDVSDGSWQKMDLPKLWEETELGVFDGSGWFYRIVELTNEQANSEITLNYGAPDDYDQAWFNGVFVGKNDKWNIPRQYKVPAGIAKPGKNVIVIRILDYQGGGGFMGEPGHYYLQTGNTKIAIDKGWLVKKGFDMADIETKPVSPMDPNMPTVLYNGMINPVIPYAMQGVIWYQGENNAGKAFHYRQLFKALITDWRAQWGQGNFPFLFVQLANYQQPSAMPVDDTWAELREAQTMALQLPNTGMAVTTDIGDAVDIHPGNKQDVGLRLALNALALVYGKDIEYASPLLDTCIFESNVAKISFLNTYKGLTTNDNKPLRGFAIAGPDKQFYWANAKIVDNKVILSSNKVKQPVAVRYNWAVNPQGNLFNSAGLPASSFRTDSWKGITEP